MGDRKFNLKHSIKGQIIFAFVLILLCSFLSTMATYFAIVVFMRPSNTSEKAVQSIEKYVSGHGTTVLNPSEQAKLQSLVEGSSVEYLVMNAQSSPIYSTLPQTPITKRADMIRKMNVTSIQHKGFVIGSTADRVIPVLGKDGSLKGAVYVKWDLTPGGMSGPNLWIHIVPFVFLLSPFLFMLLFTYIFARRVGRKINDPLQILIEATHKIQQRDLDFSIDYKGKNEISKVLDAFEDMRKELKHSLLAQWKSEEERREMLAAISHDFRTPMTIIQGHVENLLENPSRNQERFQRYLETILRNTQRVVRLMNDFRIVTEIDSPEFSLHPAKINIQEYVDSKYHEFLVVTRSCGITLLLDYKDMRLNPEAMYIDVDRLSQIIDNIMANALRYTPNGGRISWKVQAEEKILKIAIEDSGKGIPDDQVDQLFNKFYQADPSRSETKEHSGLGLYIVKSLVEKHGGTVSARSNHSGGATFEFWVRFLNDKIGDSI